jgi:AraC family transcriptional regulator, positive regulator of tynA and feaB
MSETIRSLSSSRVALKKQIQSWIDAHMDLCGQFDVDPLEGSSLEGRINYTAVSRLKLCRIELSEHRIAHTILRAKLSEHPYVKILFQTHGVSYFEQDGSCIDLIPGDCLAYDVSSSHTIISPAFTRHEAVIVPKGLLLERGFRSQKMSACKISARTGAGRIAYDFVHGAFDEATKLSPNSAVTIADSLVDSLLLPFREVDAMLDRVGSQGNVRPARSSSLASICAIPGRGQARC